jgi:hypothetical protein
MRTSRVGAIVLSTLLVVCLCAAGPVYLALRSVGWVLARSLDSEPAMVASTGSAIASYELPPGFDDGHAGTIAGFAVVAYNGDDGQSHIYLVQGPQGLHLDEDALQRQMQIAAADEPWSGVTVVERYPCQIRGEQATVVVSEGRKHDNQRYRTASVLFIGNGGPALLNFSMPAARWDQEFVDDFLNSIH